MIPALFIWTLKDLVSVAFLTILLFLAAAWFVTELVEEHKRRKKGPR